MCTQRQLQEDRSAHSLQLVYSMYIPGVILPRLPSGLALRRFSPKWYRTVHQVDFDELSMRLSSGLLCNLSVSSGLLPGQHLVCIPNLGLRCNPHPSTPHPFTTAPTPCHSPFSTAREQQIAAKPSHSDEVPHVYNGQPQSRPTPIECHT